MIFSWKYRCLVLGLILVLSSCESGRKNRSVDWFPYYELEKTTPFGLYIFNAELDLVTPKFADVTRTTRSVSGIVERELKKIPFERTTTYLYIDAHCKMNSASRQALKEMAYSGAHVFIASHELNHPEFLVEGAAYRSNSMFFNLGHDSLHLFLNDGKISGSCDRIQEKSYFEILDSSQVVPLGYYSKSEKSSERFCNFIAVRYGEGLIYYHTMPEVFTNYFLKIKDNYKYTQALISHWKFGNIFWFVNYKTEFEGDYGMLSYLFSQPALTAAWYLLWLILILAVFTYAKRTQRTIPVLRTKSNFSLEYAKGVARFHLLQRNYHGLIEKYLVVFLDKMRSEYRLDTSTIDIDFAHKLHAMTNCDRLAAEDFVKFVKKHRSRSVSFDFDFEELRVLIKKINL